jgi:hypothetical protein
MGMTDLIAALRAKDLKAVRAAIAADGKLARQARPVVEAGRLAFQPALALLKESGAGLNASWRNYRALHSLLQEDPHGVADKPAPARLACLEWLLQNGADLELLGAWPSAWAIIVAAFVGSPGYVAVLRRGGAKMDGFAGAALGDGKRVEKALRKSPEFARERDHDGLTALQCAAGSRMPKVDTVAIARLLIDAGADVGALTKSWAHDVTPRIWRQEPGTGQCSIYCSKGEPMLPMRSATRCGARRTILPLRPSIMVQP